jgi:AcrR family transcriptional regulator
LKKNKENELEPQQARSRESLQKLLRAAREVLGNHGVEGTTIPRIAQHAGLTPGSVYRRFHDKESLLESAILGLLESQDHASRTFTAEMAREIPLRVLSEQIINSVVVNYRARAPLIRAMRQFVDGRLSTAFKKKASRLEVCSFERIVDLFMTHSDRIQHPNPRMAISMALMMVISSIHELIVRHTDLGGWKHLLPGDDQGLKRELVRAFLNYLRVEDTPGAAGSMEAEQLAAMKRWHERSSQNV